MALEKLRSRHADTQEAMRVEMRAAKEVLQLSMAAAPRLEVDSKCWGLWKGAVALPMNLEVWGGGGASAPPSTRVVYMVWVPIQGCERSEAERGAKDVQEAFERPLLFA